MMKLYQIKLNESMFGVTNAIVRATDTNDALLVLTQDIIDKNGLHKHMFMIRWGSVESVKEISEHEKVLIAV